MTTTPKIDTFGTCALCLHEGKLRNSHIISEFLYAAMYDEKHRFHVIEAGKESSDYEQKGYRERLLCQICETKLSVWEKYGRRILVGDVELQYRQEAGITWVHGIDYQQFKLFQLSILWRAGVATSEFFGKVTLGPHAEILRKMLLADDPGEPWQYGCLMIGIRREGNMVPVIVQPTPARVDGARWTRFTFGGYLWMYRVASQKPINQQGFLEAVLQRSGRLALKFGDLKDAGFYRDFLLNHVSKGPWRHPR